MEAVNFIVRSTSPKDQRRVLNFLKKVKDDFYPSLSETQIKDFSRAATSNNGCAVVIENKKDIEAVVQFREHYSGKTDAKIDVVAVHPKYRHKGDATILLIEVLNLLRRDKIKKVILRTWPKNKKAIKLYEKTGFKKTETRIELIRNKQRKSIYMEKKL